MANKTTSGWRSWPKGNCGTRYRSWRERWKDESLPIIGFCCANCSTICLCQAAWAVSTKKNNYLSALYRRLAARRGVKRATIAVAHNLLAIAYYILRDGTCYQDLGPDSFDRFNLEGLRRRLTRRLEGLGFKVTLEPLANVA